MNPTEEDDTHSTDEITTKDPTGTGDYSTVCDLHGKCVSNVVRSESPVSNIKLRNTMYGRTTYASKTDGDTPLEASGSIPFESSLDNLPLKQYHGHSLFRCTIVLALIFRLLLLIFSVWQDKTRWPDGQLRFTDVDYDVFSDAARAMLNGDNIYQSRPTYRYSPLLAAMLIPGHWFLNERSLVDELQSVHATSFFDPPIHRVVFPHTTDWRHLVSRLWGKFVFIFADLTCAWFQYRIILTEAKHHDTSGEVGQHVAALLVSVAWLFNPVTAVVSVRGSAEPVIGVCVLACLLALLQRRICVAGILFGLCVHLKLYPIIYAPAVYVWLSRQSKRCNSSPYTNLRSLLPSVAHFIFGSSALISFVALTSAAYYWFGGTHFLHQAYLYHFTRSDFKHNFAPHFYPLYLLSGLKWKVNELESMTGDVVSSSLSDYSTVAHLFARLRTTLTGVNDAGDFSASHAWLNWLTRVVLTNVNMFHHVFNVLILIPSMVLIPFLSFKLHRSLGFCWFAITYAFVTFNKVCTSQYFLWSLVLLPVALPHLKLPPTLSIRRATLECLLVWFGAQALWLAAAYTLEMRTPRSSMAARYIWLLVWFGSIVFVTLNVWLLRRLLRWRRVQPFPESIINPLEHESKKTR